MKPFQFKQFQIIQEHSAMKVGTDGVLLGAWADVLTTKNVLDIGSGTGLISLMLAQRNSEAQITALEIEENAYLESLENFKNSKWKDRLKSIHSDFTNFTAEAKFDLIVSNPPFYSNTFQAQNKERNTARQTDTLSFATLLSKTATLLSNNGKACFIIPFSEEEKFFNLARSNNLFLNKTLRIKGNINTETKRSLLAFSFQEPEIIMQKEISIEISRHNYTNEYIELVKDFYLKM